MCGDDLTRANIMKAGCKPEDFTPDTLLPGVKINTSATDFAPIGSFDDALQGEKWEPVRRLISGEGRPLIIFRRRAVARGTD
jgi:branched-chain amino acid transport system substrate-binding protein